jgi:hypothetical protein
MSRCLNFPDILDNRSQDVRVSQISEVLLISRCLNFPNILDIIIDRNVEIFQISWIIQVKMSEFSRYLGYIIEVKMPEFLKYLKFR